MNPNLQMFSVSALNVSQLGLKYMTRTTVPGSMSTVSVAFVSVGAQGRWLVAEVALNAPNSPLGIFDQPSSLAAPVFVRSMSSSNAGVKSLLENVPPLILSMMTFSAGFISQSVR